MKKRLLISIITLFLCTSCNGSNSSLNSSTENSMIDSLLDKYQYGYVRMPDGIFEIKSKLRHHNIFDRTGIVNSVALLEFSNGVVTKLNQHYEGSVYYSSTDCTVSYDGNVYFDGKTKYEDEFRTANYIFDNQISEKHDYYKYEVNELSFFGNKNSNLCGEVIGYLDRKDLLAEVYYKTRIQLQDVVHSVVIEGNSAMCVKTNDIDSSYYSNEVFFDENLDYFKEEIVYNSGFIDANFTFQRVDSFVSKTIENEEDYIVKTEVHSSDNQVYII